MRARILLAVLAIGVLFTIGCRSDRGRKPATERGAGFAASGQARDATSDLVASVEDQLASATGPGKPSSLLEPATDNNASINAQLVSAAHPNQLALAAEERQTAVARPNTARASTSVAGFASMPIRGVGPISDSEATEWAQRWITGVENADQQLIEQLFWWDELLDRSARRTFRDQAVVEEVRTYVSGRTIADGLVRTLRSQQQPGDYRLLKITRQEGQTRVILRVANETSFLYHEFGLRRINGEVRGDFAFFPISGDELSGNLDRALIEPAARLPEYRVALTKENQARADEVLLLNAMIAAVQSEEFELAHEIYSRMSYETQNSPLALVQSLKSSLYLNEIDQAVAVHQKLVDSGELHASAATWGMQIGLLSNNVELMEQSLEALRTWVEGDSFLELRFAMELLVLGNRDRAVALARTLDPADLNLGLAHHYKLTLAMAGEDHAESLRQATILRDSFDDLPDLKARDGYESFEQTDEFKQWQQTNRRLMASLPSMQLNIDSALELNLNEADDAEAAAEWAADWIEIMHDSGIERADEMVAWNLLLERAVTKLTNNPLITTKIFQYSKLELAIEPLIRSVIRPQDRAYKIANVLMRERETHLIFRDLAKGLEYHDVHLVRIGNRIVAKDIFSAQLGVSVAADAGEMMLVRYVDQLEDKSELQPSVRGTVDMLKRQNTLLAASTGGPDALIAAYRALPPQEQVARKTIRLALPNISRPMELMKILDRYWELYLDDAFVGIHGINSKLATENFALLERYHKQLRTWIGNDPFLDLLVGASMVRLGRVKEAQELTSDIDADDVGLIAANEFKLTIALAVNDHNEAVRQLSALAMINPDVPLPSHRELQGFAEFEMSDAYELWQKNRESVRPEEE